MFGINKHEEILTLVQKTILFGILKFSLKWYLPSRQQTNEAVLIMMIALSGTISISRGSVERVAECTCFRLDEKQVRASKITFPIILYRLPSLINRLSTPEAEGERKQQEKQLSPAVTN